MARIRTIKPEFWSDEKLSECSLSARLTFIGLWSFADDEGRMEYQPVRLRMQIFPCGSVTLSKLTEYVGELTEYSLIRVYLVDGKQYLDIPGFAKHQRINRPTPSRLPEYSVSAHGGITERSPLEGKGTGTGYSELRPLASESNTGDVKGKPSPSSRRSPALVTLPGDFTLTPELTEYARARLPDANVVELFERFSDQARSKAWRYADWPRAWQTYVRNCSPNSGHFAAGQYPKAGAGGVRWM